MSERETPASTNARVDHTMSRILLAIGVDMGFRGGNDELYLKLIRKELGLDLRIFAVELSRFFERHPFEETRNLKEGDEDAENV